ncbi:unnamed protein product [Brassica rapa]|uniref:Uncharacterized protein n=1 Tax=Brassica campestris TaxID=3711 RepID=A0A3P5YJK5_BRACM|nr:unnamed protein product [Brassica rapa]VDC67857.1 unnamed protein product [Brassica rapa]
MSHIISALSFDILSEILKLKALCLHGLSGVGVCVFCVRAITPTTTLSLSLSHFIFSVTKTKHHQTYLFF